MNERLQLFPILVGVALIASGCEEPPVEPGPDTSGPVATGLTDPFELVWGPDADLWVTERTAKRVTRVSLADGTQTIALTIDEVLVTQDTQDGLLGMVFHTELLGAGEDHVFLAYTYDADPSPGGLDRRVKIVRYTYDPATVSLVSPVELIRGLPGSNDHNAGRLAIGPDGKLHYTIGDRGNNQLDNHCQPIRAQELPTTDQIVNENFDAYQGKVLRMNLDGSIPEDNPTIEGTKSHIYSYGHRNPQGLAIAMDGKVYVAEHGPKTDDELNLIEAGMNYGWPNVAGHKDDQAYVYADWSQSVDPPCAELEYSDYEIPPSVPQVKESAFDHPDFRPPLRTFYTVEDGYDFQDPDCAASELYYMCWPTIAPSSVAVHEPHSDEPGKARRWLLMTSLKQGAVFRMELSEDGKPADGEPEILFQTVNRYRDTALAPDGRTVFVVTDGKGNMMGPEGPTSELENPGAILRFRLPD